ncbi:MAG TPA: hypothetical protein VFX59_28870 [Polyangiales bacterium]|nr:hypothetical protein [Polyangiales bacterium]
MGERCHDLGRDPVELLLRRIVDRTLMGSLVTGAALAAGCSDDGGNGRFEDPSTGVDGGFLIPIPIAPRDAGNDARAVVGEDAAADAGPEASTDAQTDAGVPSEVPAGAFDPCSRGAGFPVRAEGLSLSAPADYAAVRLASGIQGAPDAVEAWTSDQFTRVSERGTACATARSDACNQKVALHPEMLEQSYCVQACVEWSVVTTRGDDVQRWATPPELLALLGAIDSDDDALMFAAGSGFDVTCPAPGESITGANLRYVRTTAEGRELIGVRYANTCPVVLQRVQLLVTTTGELRELQAENYPQGDSGCVGRVPAGLHPMRARDEGLGGYLARCAYLEAASVHAFERLARELREFGAPSALVARASAAARDEVRHARVVRRLAEARGARVEDVRVDALERRTLAEIARENAVEGCVRETYGALVGAWQAARAHDPELRHAMRPIAADEARHAQLSHDVHTWLMTKLDERDRTQVHDAQRHAIATLERECARSPGVADAGLPDAHEARLLLSALDESLWAA